ncbi:hypothetical protein KP509_20G079800 [Ceratopteris richardii]|uniref:Uncharacterized protein n=1 Tax=Ceratopteris richardii TaxID=49495 RepID=A0A8T2SK69_CERRI|nr:hypothetical protein KP509_20G079800 [Ceratopteris richardii]
MRAHLLSPFSIKSFQVSPQTEEQIHPKPPNRPPLPLLPCHHVYIETYISANRPGMYEPVTSLHSELNFPKGNWTSRPHAQVLLFPSDAWPHPLRTAGKNLNNPQNSCPSPPSLVVSSDSRKPKVIRARNRRNPPIFFDDSCPLLTSDRAGDHRPAPCQPRSTCQLMVSRA